MVLAHPSADDVEAIKALYRAGVLALVADNIHDDNQALAYAQNRGAYIISDDQYRYTCRHG